MRILHIVDSLHAATGGPSRSVPRLADEQVAQGHEVVVVANDYRELGPNILPSTARAVLVPARRLPFRLGAWSRGLAAILWAEIQKAEIIHIHGLWLRTNHLGMRMARQQRKPFIVSPRGMLEAWARNHRALRKMLWWHLAERRLLSLASFLHATAEAEAASIRRALPGVPIVIAPNGIDPFKHYPAREVIESRFPVLAGSRLLLFLSRLHPKKGVPELLTAWQKIEGEFRPWLLVLAGDDFDGGLARYQKYAADLGISQRVIFTGHLEGEEKHSLLGACELFVLPSHSENFGLAIGEALAAGKPVIATEATPWAAIRDTRCGWWIPVGEESLAAALISALKQPPEELFRMGGRGAALIDARYSWREATDILLQTYQSALASPACATHSLPQ